MKAAYRVTLTPLLRIMALLAMIWSIAPTMTAQTWNEVTSPPVYTANCITGQNEQLGRASVAWYGNLNSPPPVNTVYYARISWSVTGDPCQGGAEVAPELFLPDGTTLAISAANPIYCTAVLPQTTAPEYAQCPKMAATGVRGGLGFYPVGGSNVAWPTPQGTGWQMLVPLLSTTPLSGTVTTTDPTMPCSSCLTAAVWFIDGVASPWAFPRVGVKINGPSGAPSITYPSPSISNVTTTGATGTAILSREGTTGSLFIEESTTPPSSGSTCTASSNHVAVTSSTASVSSYPATFSSLLPGTFTYWRMCYTTSGNATYIGATQSFQTKDLPPQVTSISPAMALPGRSVTITGAHLVEASSVSINGSQNVVTATITNKTANSVTFTVPNIPFQTGTVSVTTPAGTATSTSTFSVGIDTILDNYQGTTTNSNGTVNLTIHFHSTEPSPNVQFNCELNNGPTAQTCDAGVVSYPGLIGMNNVTITAHANGYSDPTPLVLHFLFVPARNLSPVQAKIALPADSAGVTTDTANSTFMSQGEESGFECTRNASAGWVACASPNSSTALPPAMKRLIVAARDAGANGNSGPDTAGVPADPLPSGTALLRTGLLTSFPEPDVQTTTSRTASFSFQSERGVGFQCSLDYAAWAPCESAVFLADLAVGPHTFLVRGVDNAGKVDFLPAAKSWTIE